MERKLFLATRYRGVQQRVAKSLGISRSMVSQVVAGTKKSAKVIATLDREISTIEQEIAEAAQKPRIRFSYFFTHTDGDIMASGNLPFCGLTAIGRIQPTHKKTSGLGQADRAPRVANAETKPQAAAHVSIQSAGNSDHGKKPFVKLSCVAELGAAFVASAPGMDECVLIGRNQETGWLSGVEAHAE